MKQIHLLFSLILIFTFANTAAATSWSEEVGEISYQVQEADRIIIGTVTNIQPFYDHTDVTIEVDEWFKDPLPSKVITVKTEEGRNVRVAGAASFTTEETVILMLEDEKVSESRFGVMFGEVGKHPLSDRDAVVRELEAGDLQQRNGDSEDELLQNPPNPVKFFPPTSDRGLDMDGDGLYDYLIVELSARTSEPGSYYFTGELSVPLGTHEEDNGMIGIGSRIIELASAAVYLNETVKTITINFEGGCIRDNWMNGPYEVSISVSNETWGFGHAFDHTTEMYDYTEFEQPDVLLSGPVRSKTDAVELAREKAAEIGVVVGEVNHTEILIEQSCEVWAFDFKGDTFDERFVIYGNTTDKIVHRTMNATTRGIPINGVPFIGAAGVLAVLLGAVLLARVKR